MSMKTVKKVETINLTERDLDMQINGVEWIFKLDAKKLRDICK